MRDNNILFNSTITSSSLKVANAVDLHFLSGVARMWSGNGQITIDGNVYIGAGGYGEISATNETGDLSAQGRQLTLNGVPSENIITLQNEVYKNRLAKEYVILFNESGSYLTHECVFVGRMDTLSVKEDNGTCTIALNIENHLLDLGRPRIKRYTQTQLEADNGALDYGLQFIPGIQSTQVTWGEYMFQAPLYQPPTRGAYGL